MWVGLGVVSHVLSVRLSLTPDKAAGHANGVNHGFHAVFRQPPLSVLRYNGVMRSRCGNAGGDTNSTRREDDRQGMPNLDAIFVMSRNGSRLRPHGTVQPAAGPLAPSDQRTILSR
jgi:hypothetical protein